MISLVTGGTGYFGGHLVQVLLDAGDEVRVLHRRGSDVSRLPGTVVLCEGDITQPQSLEKAALGCDRIFHSAALVKNWARNPSLFDRINVEGTLHVCQTARRLGCRLIYTSSFFALGPTGPHPVRENHQRATLSYCTDYERTKSQALQRVRKEIEGGLEGIILYPGMIYGPGPLTQGNFIGGMARDMRQRRMPGLPGDGQQKITLAYIDDVAAGHLAAAEKGLPGRDYILGGPIATIEEVCAILGRLLVVKPPSFRIPIGVLKGLGWVSVQVARAAGISPQITPGVAETLRHHWAYDSSRAAGEIGYRMRPIEEGLSEVVRYIRAFAD